MLSLRTLQVAANGSTLWKCLQTRPTSSGGHMNIDRSHTGGLLHHNILTKSFDG